MPRCPEGHESTATDYCDYCGSPMVGEPQATTLQVTQCPGCGALMEGRYCEDCGHDSVLGAPEPVAAPTVTDAPAVPITVADAAATWVATITADPAHFQRMRAQKGPDMDRVDFPAYYPARRIPLPEGDVLIGKRSSSQGVNPEIDLSIAPADIAVSRSHAILRLADATVTVTDLGSTNGTCVNDSPTPIPVRTPVPLRPGDRIHVGGWTTITLTTETA
ncbi:FHA domain-containing protein [Nocardia sp. NPDC055321]